MNMTMNVGCNIYLVLAKVVPVVWLRPGLANQGSTWHLCRSSSSDISTWKFGESENRKLFILNYITMIIIKPVD